MQELIEKVEHAISYNVEGGLVEKYTWTELFNDTELALKKEKEHLMMAFNDGKTNAVLKKRTSEEYYNQLYE